MSEDLVKRITGIFRCIDKSYGASKNMAIAEYIYNCNDIDVALQNIDDIMDEVSSNKNTHN